MFAQCPHCKTVCSVDVAQLRATLGTIVCKQCASQFNALESLSDIPAVLPESIAEDSDQYWLITYLISKARELWAVGFSLSLLLLGFQIYHYHSHQIVQNVHLRPWLSQLCASLTCTLPDYKNVQELSVLNGELVHQEDGSYQFISIIVNQATFTQPLPAFKLVLVNFVGDAFAYRIFYPSDYLPDLKNPNVGSNQSIQIQLHLAPVATAIGGYYFEVL